MVGVLGVWLAVTTEALGRRMNWVLEIDLGDLHVVRS